MRTSFIAAEVSTGLRRNLTMTIAVIITTAVSLALFGLAILTGKQVETMKDYWYDKVEVSMYLCLEDSKSPSCRGGAVTSAQREAIREDLEKLRPLVAEVFYESKVEALGRFKELFEGSAIAETATADQLPESFRVKLSDPSQYDVIFSAFNGRPGVEQVQDQREVLEPFFRLLRAVSVGALLLSGVILAAALLLIINTIRLSAFSRRRETGIMRLVGASNFSIRLPFILEGAICGAIGALLAAAMVAGAKWGGIDRYLEPNFEFTSWIGWGAVVGTMPWLFLLGIAGSAGVSAITLRRYLKV
ncbi:MAG: permease-like cell division protein FtsX [Sporichthyaceae bacterium]